MENLIYNESLDVLTSKIFSFLDYPSVLAARKVSFNFRNFVDHDKDIWLNQVQLIQQYDNIKLNPEWSQICKSFEDRSLDIETIKKFVKVMNMYVREGPEFSDPIQFYDQKQRYEDVDYLIDLYHKEDKDKHGCFWRACAFGTVETVRRVYDSTIDVNVSIQGGLSALMASIIFDKTETSIFLLDHVNINSLAVDDTGRTAFMYACEYGRLEIVQAFVRCYGIQVNEEETNADVETGFKLAKVNGHSSILEYLLQETKVASSGTAFLFACQIGCYELARAFVFKSLGIQVNAQETATTLQEGIKLAKLNDHVFLLGFLESVLEL